MSQYTWNRKQNDTPKYRFSFHPSFISYDGLKVHNRNLVNKYIFKNTILSMSNHRDAFSSIILPRDIPKVKNRANHILMYCI